jgi:hypothetical protein
MINIIGAGILRDCPTILGLRTYDSTIWIVRSITNMAITIPHPGYSTTPAKRIGIPLIKTPNIGTKLVKKVIKPSASK